VLDQPLDVLSLDFGDAVHGAKPTRRSDIEAAYATITGIGPKAAREWMIR